MITRNILIKRYLTEIEENNALEKGALSAEATAGYWFYEASHNPRGEYNKMLKEHDILLSKDTFYSKVNGLLKEVGV